MNDEFIGVIKLFAGTFAPRGFMFCDGQLLAISQYQAVFSILGTIYGGDGRTTFALPDLRGRVPIGEGKGPGLSERKLGAKAGEEMTTLTVQELPAHTHAATFTPTGGSATPATAQVTVNAGTGGTPVNDPTDAYWGQSPDSGAARSQDYTDKMNVTMAADAVEVNITGGGGITGGNVNVASTGNGRSVNNMQPYTTLQYIICIDGLFPSRS